MTNNILSETNYQKLLSDIKLLIENNQKHLETLMRERIISTYWQIGKRIEKEKLTTNANYYAAIISDLSQEVAIDATTLQRSVQFFNNYPDQPKSSNLTWSHYKNLLAIKDRNLRLVLENKAIENLWTRDQLQINITKESQNKKNNSEQIIRPTEANYLYKAKIIDVIDGDTILLNIDLGFDVIKKQRIRLAQIDAPEISTKEGQKSYLYLRDLAANLGNIVVRTNKIDIYGRYLGDVFFSNISNNQSKLSIFNEGSYLNQKLIDQKLAKII
jgi:endonuclease YncB( thermonuclease family)